MISSIWLTIIVDAGETGLKFNILTGLSDSTFVEGYHLALPFIEMPIKFNTRVNYYDAQASTPNRDLQQIDLTARVSYKPDKSKLKEIYTTLGPKYDTNVLNNIVNEIIRGVVAQYDAQQLISDRETISN